MNIAIDLTWMTRENQHGGVFQYAMRVISSLIRYTDHKVIAIVGEDNQELFCQFNECNNFKFIVIEDVSVFAACIAQERIDVIHTPIQHHVNFTLAIPMITTLHDLQPFYFPEFFTEKEIEFRNVFYRKSAEFSERVIVSYQHVKDDLVKFYEIPPEKIDICSHGMAESGEIATTRIDAVRMKYNLPERFLLYSANTWKHKNHIGLLRGISVLQERYGILVPLICTGCQYPDYFPYIEEELERLGLCNSVRFLGYLPDDEMPAILHAAMLAVVPTLYEAGSYPLMEAMNQGVPVICSNTTSLPDTIGDLRFVFDPNSPEDMAQKMAMILTDEKLRQENIANSAVRVADWRWDKAIHSFVDCYQKAIDSFAEKRKNRWFIDWAGNYEFLMNDKIQALTKKTEQLRSKVTDLESEKWYCLATLKKSLSWRITKPLRWLGDRF